MTFIIITSALYAAWAVCRRWVELTRRNGHRVPFSTKHHLVIIINGERLGFISGTTYTSLSVKLNPQARCSSSHHRHLRFASVRFAIHLIFVTLQLFSSFIFVLYFLKIFNTMATLANSSGTPSPLPPVVIERAAASATSAARARATTGSEFDFDSSIPFQLPVQLPTTFGAGRGRGPSEADFSAL